MVACAHLYRWSSYAANTGLASDNRLTPHVEYLALASTPQARHSAYRGLFDASVEPELANAIRDATAGGYALVGDQLKTRLVAEGHRVEPVKPGPKRKPESPGDGNPADLFTSELAP